ncbi:SDR family oxidoreductase [Nonomuraea basaltis]|uniref:SDR family oxidoreductase n=1 Tax=Nonomuraea basaltis TaxID=2495887 RepID=UPI00110C6886|nr:SDR family oxidoreductase [Nonomuraea basaltis]TMR96822.1 SDR family oxidoreductase [Nonomuraea basaltis]
MQERTLVTGATATLGREVVARLLAIGHGVRVMSRRPRPAEDPQHYEWAVADLTTGRGVADAMAGVRTIVHCASGRSGRQKEAYITRTLLEAARQAGSPHLVYISIINIDQVPLAYYRGKLASEKLIEESGVPFTILRAAQFHDLVRSLFAGAAKLPVMPLPTGRLQPVDVREVADRLVELALGEPGGRVRDLAGPEIRDTGDLARAYLRITGKQRPVWTLKLPGKLFRALREGHNIARDPDRGSATFESWLAEGAHR